MKIYTKPDGDVFIQLSPEEAKLMRSMAVLTSGVMSYHKSQPLAHALLANLPEET